MRHFFASSLVIASLGALASGVSGCGQLEGDPNQAPVLATIRGQLSNPDSYAAGSNLRVAILWGGEDFGGLRVSQDVPVQPVFPSQFKLDVRNVPPQEAMRAPGEDPNKPKTSDCAPGWSPDSGKPQPSPSDTCDDDGPPLPGDQAPTPAAPPSTGGTRIRNHSDDFRPALPSDPFRFAVGTLVAYEDLNHNGKLDLLDDQATAAIDRVVGVNDGLYIVYAEGTAMGEFAKLQIPRGFSQVIVDKSCSSSDEIPDRGGDATDVRYDAGADSGPKPVPMPEMSCTSNVYTRPIDALFTLPLTASPALSEFMCSGESNSIIGVSAVSPPPTVQQSGGVNPNGPQQYPAPTDPKLHCKADGSGYSYAPCESSQNLCGDRIECFSFVVPRPETVPANWPCPAQ